MNESTAVMEDAPIAQQFAAPDEMGRFDELAGERINAPVIGKVSLLAALQIIQQVDGWRAGAIATLPESPTHDSPISLYHRAYPTRAEAITHALEDLIVWCSDQKERGSKRHKQQAAQLQDWALEVEQRESAKEISPDAADESGLEQSLPELHTSAIEPAGELPQAAALTDGELRMIPIEQLFESEWNPRQHYPEAAMAELVESMCASGFHPWQPLMVRPLGEDSEVWRTLIQKERPGYEIGAGHRRARAARLAGITAVPCIVRTLADAEFLRILNCDNSGRQDVHPLHEAAGWRTWIERTGITVLEIAALIGRSKEYVYQRLKCCDLIEAGQRLWLEGFIDAGHAVEIARRPERTQREAVQFCTPPAYDLEQRVSLPKLRAWIREHGNLSLPRAPFSPADDTLPILQGSLMDVMGPVFGSCIECPKRSGANPQLFSDIEDPNVCTDPACYRNKAQAFEDRKPKPEAEAPRVKPAPPAPKPKPAVQPVDEPADESADEDRRQQAEEEQRQREERIAESARIARENEAAEQTYARGMNAILEKVSWPLSQADLVDVFAVLLDSFECLRELADKFAVPTSNGPVNHDLIRASVKFQPVKIARMIFAGILLDAQVDGGSANNPLLNGMARRYKVDLAKIRKSVDAEIEERLGLRKLSPPAVPSRKDAIAKLGTLGAPVAPSAKARKAPAKKVAVKAAKGKAKK